jgi:hypothetical protein
MTTGSFKHPMIHSHAATDAYREGMDRIFGNKKKSESTEERKVFSIDLSASDTISEHHYLKICATFKAQGLVPEFTKASTYREVIDEMLSKL